MDNKKSKIIILGLIFLLFIQTLHIMKLELKLSDTENSIVNLKVEEDAKMSNYFLQLEERVKKEASIIESFEYTFGSPNMEEYTIPMTIIIYPKEINKEGSNKLLVSGQEAPLEIDGTMLKGTIMVDIFKELDSKLIIEDKSKSKIEKLEINEDLISKAFPFIKAQCKWREGVFYTKDSQEAKGEYCKEGALMGTVAPTESGNNIISAKFMVEIDGEVVSEEKLDTFNGLWLDINEKHTITANQTVNMLIVGVDTYGFTHKYILDRFQLNDNAEPIYDNKMNFINHEIILDPKGHVVYTSASF